MYQKYDNNPYELLYKYIKEAVENRNNEEYFDEDDDILQLILLNNGATIHGNKMRFKTEEIIPDYYISFVKSADTNEANEYYDIVEFNGSLYIVIFIDYFKDIGAHNGDGILENSIYFNAIFNIVNDFILLTSKIIGKSNLAKTSASFNNRYVPLIIAGKIIKECAGQLVQEDTALISIEDLEKYINQPLQLVLLGIRSTK